MKGCQILKLDRPKQYAFIIRGLQWTSVIERIFQVEDEADRNGWCESIAKTARLLERIEQFEDIEMMDASESNAAIASRSSSLHISNKDSSRGRRIALDDFEFLKVLGKGTFGKVILCREKKTGLFFAIKVLKKEVIIAKDEVAHTLTENRVLRRTKHPFLIVSLNSYC